MPDVFCSQAQPVVVRLAAVMSRPCAGIMTAFLLLIGQELRGATLISNGDFSSSLTDWHPVGGVFDTGQTAVLTDQEGSRAVIFQTAVIPGGALSLQLDFDLLLSLSSNVPVGRTPDSFFGTIYLGSMPFGDNYEAGIFDSAIGLLDADYRGPANLTAGLTTSASPKGPGWNHYSMQLPIEAFITVMFEYFDGNGQADSVTAVDNVRIDFTPVPETGTSFLCLTSAMLMAAFRRKRTH